MYMTSHVWMHGSQRDLKPTLNGNKNGGANKIHTSCEYRLPNGSRALLIESYIGFSMVPIDLFSHLITI